MNWIAIAAFIYAVILIAVCGHILYETRNSTKTLAYLLLCLFLPLFGIIFYLAFGVNYWKKKHYNKKTKLNAIIHQQLKNNISAYDEIVSGNKNDPTFQHVELALLLINDINSPVTRLNKVKLLMNGEQKFPDLLQAMKEAKHHLHIEYYIFEYDEIGMQVIDMMIRKATEGVEVRFIYDDFGSPALKKETERRLQEAGVEVYPFYKVHFYLLANRLNYRNHRKIVVIDGKTGFVGGINVSDKYINNGKNKLYWRDTHLRIDGPAVYYLQYLFITDWNFCCAKKLNPGPLYFAKMEEEKKECYVQIAAGGPDSFMPSILYSQLQAINLAEEEILITTPYFIPGDSILDALCIAALSGLTVKLLVPGKSDSKFVNAASRSYYTELLQAGVEIYLYQKGFVHAKTMVSDGKLSVIGTANMDNRSFDLNFEVNALVYDKEIAGQMRKQFFEDISYAERIDKEAWLSRSAFRQLPEKVAKLFSPVM